MGAQQRNGFGKQGAVGLQRLVPVDAHKVVRAQLPGDQQLAAVAVELRQLVGQADVVARIVTRSPGKVQATAQKVRTPGFFGRVKPKNVFVLAAYQLVAEVAVTALAVGVQQVFFQRLHVQWGAGLVAHLRGKRASPLCIQTHRLYRVQRQLRDIAAGHPAQPDGVVRRVQRQALQLVLRPGGRCITACDGVVAALEVSRRDAVQIGLDVNVDARPQQAQRLGDILFGQQIDHLRRHRERRGVDVLGLEQRRADVDGNHHIGLAQIGYLGNRHLVYQAAIDQAQALVLDGGHQARHRHGCAHQRSQVAVAPGTPLAGDDVGSQQG